MLAGYSPIRDHISDLAAVGAPTRTLMNVGLGAFAIGVGAAAWPLRRIIGKSASGALAVDALMAQLVAPPSVRREPRAADDHVDRCQAQPNPIEWDTGTKRAGSPSRPRNP